MGTNELNPKNILKAAGTGLLAFTKTGVTKYTAAGTVDTSYGDGGVVQLRVANPADVSARTVQVLARSNGSAVLGFTNNKSVTAIAVDANGRTRGPADVAPTSGNLSALYRQPDGGVLAVTGSGDVALQKFTLVGGRWQAGPSVPGEGDDQFIADTTHLWRSEFFRMLFGMLTVPWHL